MQAALFESIQMPGHGPAKSKAALVKHAWNAYQGIERATESLELFDRGMKLVEVERFGSGCSAKWDLLGYALVDQPLGTVATEMGPEQIELVAAYVNRGGRVFVDSGAIEAFTSGKQLDFEGKVFPVYEALLAKVKKANGLVLVMPDIIGDEHGTRAVQEENQGRILEWMDAGAECIFPLQNPRSDTDAEFQRVNRMAGGRPWTVGFPSNKAAWKPAQCIEFIGRHKPGRVHFLGLAREAVMKQIQRGISAVSAGTRVSCDSCEIVAHAGYGRRLTDRCFTRMNSAIDYIANGAWLRDEWIDLPDFSTYMSCVWDDAGFVSEEAAVVIAEALGYTGEDWAKRFRAAASEGFSLLFSELDPDEEWLYQALGPVVRKAVYEPWLRKLLSGPIRAWEVARIAAKDDPAWMLFAKAHCLQ